MKFRAAFAAVTLCVFLFSCATAPVARPPEGEEFSSLGNDAFCYARVNVSEARPLLDSFILQKTIGGKKIDADRAKKLFARTNSAVIALYESSAPRRFLIGAQGRYPVLSAGFSFAVSSSWKRERADNNERYWKSSDGFSLAFTKTGALLSDGSPFASLPPPAIPESFPLYRDKAISGWIPDPSSRLPSIFGLGRDVIHIPVTSFVFFVESGRDDSEAPTKFRLETRLGAPSSREAKALFAILNILRNLNARLDSSGDSRLSLFQFLLGESPRVDGDEVVLRSSWFSSGDISLLYDFVSIYSH